jgi:hypothetical protein
LETRTEDRLSSANSTTHQILKYLTPSSVLESAPMICPLDHEDADYRFGAARIEESLVLRICPKCGIVFAPTVRKEETENPHAEKVSSSAMTDLPSERQILKWP